MNELLPCPFCGYKPSVEQTGNKTLRIRCRCGVEFKQSVLRFDLHWLQDKLIEAWNKRLTD